MWSDWLCLILMSSFFLFALSGDPPCVTHLPSQRPPTQVSLPPIFTFMFMVWKFAGHTRAFALTVCWLCLNGHTDGINVKNSIWEFDLIVFLGLLCLVVNYQTRRAWCKIWRRPCVASSALSIPAWAQPSDIPYRSAYVMFFKVDKEKYNTHHILHRSS